MRILAVGLAMALLAVPAAVAGAEPAFYYLADDEGGIFTPGIATSEGPDENATGSVRVLTYADASAPSHVFHAPDASRDQLRGAALVGAWISPDLAVDANVSAVLYEVAENGTRTVIAQSNHSLILDPASVNPATLLPPDPTDPEGAAYHVQAQAMAALAATQIVYYMPGIDHKVASGSHIAVGFHMSEGSLGVPLGVTGIEYGSQDAPSFLYAPWYAPDPAPQPPAPAPEPAEPAAPDEPEAMEDEPMEEESSDSEAEEDHGAEADDDSKDSPGAAPLLVLAALAGIALVRRQS